MGMAKYVYNWFGCKTIGGRNGHKVCIQYVGKPIDGWKEYYAEPPINGKPWRKWFSNPVFCNKSGYDKALGEYRVWFCLLWHSIQL